MRRLAASQHNHAVLLLEQQQFAEARSAFEEAITTKLTIGKRSGLRQGTGADAAMSYWLWDEWKANSLKQPLPLVVSSKQKRPFDMICRASYCREPFIAG